MDKLIFFVITIMTISSAPVFAVVFFSKRFEQILPLSFTAIVAILLVFGILGKLFAGIFVLLGLALLLLLAALSGLFKIGKEDKVRFRSVLGSLFSPGAIIFAFLSLALVYINYGKRPVLWDEFSHWADSVKVMATLGDFVTNPNSQSWFPSYPPGMACVQYFFVRLYMLFCGGVYVDWLLYYSYQLFSFSFILPFVPTQWKKNPVKAVLCTAALMLVPCALFNQNVSIISTTYIDPFLAVLMACGLAMVFVPEERDSYRLCYVCCTAFMLVLSKAAGLLLAVFVLAGFCLSLIAEKKAIKRSIGETAAVAAAVLVPWLLWAYERHSSAITQSFSSKDGEVSLQLVLNLMRHADTSYRQLAHDNYYTELFKIGTSNVLVPLPLWILVALALVLLFVLCRNFSRHNESDTPGLKFLPALMLVEIVIYVVGLCYTFALKFIESEAVSSMGQYRYVCVVVLALLMVLTIVLSRIPWSGRKERICAALCAVLLVSQLPFSDFGRAIRREGVIGSQEAYSQFEPLIQNLQALCPEGSDVYVVGQGRYTPNWQQIKYGLRPIRIQEDGEWYQLWEEAPAEYPGSVTPEEWAAKLAENYDYVAIFKTDEYFAEKYGKLFEEGSDIEEAAVYSVDPVKGSLRKIS